MIISVVVGCLGTLAAMAFVYFSLTDSIFQFLEMLAGMCPGPGADLINKMIVYYDHCFLLLGIVIFAIMILGATHEEQDTYYR